jgi:hypothetical protein
MTKKINMETKEMNIRAYKPFIIVNPIYDTVFMKMIEDLRIAKFFISTIIEQQVEDVVPQDDFTYKLNPAKVSDKSKDKRKKESDNHYFLLRLDFIATVRDADGASRKILIEFQKSWETSELRRFRDFLEEHVRVDYINGKKVTLPVTIIYILDRNIAEIECPCLKVGRTQVDMLNQQTVNIRSEFIENITYETYIIQANRIPDVPYTTNLEKLLSIFEQRYFIVDGSTVRKEYPYQPDENIELITDILYEMGADPQKRKEVENEEEARRIVNRRRELLLRELEELDKQIEERDKKIEENKKKIEEKDKEKAELIEKIA